MSIEQPNALLQTTIAFNAEASAESLASAPPVPAVFALYGAHGEPYVGRTPNLRSRLRRLLQPSPQHPRRLQLASLVQRIAWRQTASDFESILIQFAVLDELFAAQSLQRMHLKAPAFVRYLGSNPYPRLTITHRPSLRDAPCCYGPFASHVAAERYVDELLKLFLLRRCTDELIPALEHPGCVYGEMKMCLAPCQLRCSDERYRQEASAIESFLATRGESLRTQLQAERQAASEALEFEAAATLHVRIRRAEEVMAMASELVRPLSRLRAIVLQQSIEPAEVNVFLFEQGTWRGPAAFSTLGMRIQNEQSGSTSLFAHPVSVEAVPEADFTPPDVKPSRVAKGVLESRMEAALAQLTQTTQLIQTGQTNRVMNPGSATTVRQGHLSLLTRWYYRPLARREGEIFFADGLGNWPLRQIIRGVGRVAGKAIAANHSQDISV